MLKSHHVSSQQQLLVTSQWEIENDRTSWRDNPGTNELWRARNLQ